MRVSGVLIVVFLGAAVAACDSFGLKQLSGQTTDANSGEAVGNQFKTSKVIPIPANAAIDAMIGGELGGKLNHADHKAVYEAQYRALEYNRSGAPVAWNNPSSGNNGEVVPGPAYTINNSQCRDYTHTIYIKSEPEVVRGTACRQSDGTWHSIT